MALFGDDDPFGAPARRSAAHHEIGEPVDRLSLEELAERIEMLRDEIERLEAVKAAKLATKQAADAFFKS